MKTAISGINNGDPSLREKGIDKAEVLEGPEGIEALADCLASGKRFAILVGAGISRSAGILLSGEIVADLRSKFPAEFKDQNDLDYASVIQRALPTPADRRVYFDHLSAGTRPELEHLILASNLDKRRFSMVLSTNFDHLLEMAATDVCQKNLAVSLYNSRFSKADISVHSPKLVKLHGDFLFDDIANLEEEKQRHLNQDMQEKISAALRGQD